MNFGYFDDENREYVIRRPDTPQPWINYLGSEDYFGLISNTAGGYSFYRDARLRRLTRYRYNNAPQDTGGRYVYLRDDTNGEFWSPTWQPVRSALDEYECRHGLGYTRIRSLSRGIAASLLYFVPLGQSLEIWQMELENRRSQPVQLSLFSLVEFCLWDAWDDATNFQRNWSTGEVELDGGVIYHRTEYRERRNHFSFFACSEELAGFDTQREAFLGAYRGWESPQVVETGRSGNSVAHGWAPVGSHHVALTLKPGEKRTVQFILGYHENPEDQKFEAGNFGPINKSSVRPIIERYLKEEEVNNAFLALKNHWARLLNAYQVHTPDIHTNRMVNIWNAYQCMTTFNMSRSASYFESGIGRGMGFRDSNQDLLGFVHMIPERARQRILDLAATQMENGGAYHQYQPLTKRGNNDVGSNFNDDPLWLILSTTAYIKESGDFSILDQAVVFDNRPGTEQPLYVHLQRSLDYITTRLGPHGLPLIGRADWNDCLNLNCFSTVPGQSFQTTTNKEGQTAESIFIAGLYVLACQEMVSLANRLGHTDEARGYELEAGRMAERILEHGWDGEWFRRAYDDFGEPVGSKLNDQGQIFIEPQGMCVMAGIGHETGQARLALDSVEKHLATPHGIVLQQPAYQYYHLNLGEISTYPPGYKENAGIFCHTNPWIMIAETRVGRPDRAFDYYSRINPSVREHISEIHRQEPYVYAQMIAGKDAPTHGEAKNSWLTGTAAWNYVAITQWILGVRPDYDGLIVNPALPSSWTGYHVSRVFRGRVFDIEVVREGPGNQITLWMDGVQQEGCRVPLPGAGQDKISVRVVVK